MEDKNTTNDVPDTEEKKPISFKPTSIVGIVLIAAIIAIIVLSSLTYVKTVSDENTINTLREQLIALQSQLSTARAEITSLENQVTVTDAEISTLTSKEADDISALQDDLTSTSGQVASLSSQIDSVLTQISGLQSQVSYDASEISMIQTELASIDSQLNSLSTTTTSLQNTLTTLENTVDSLVEQVNELTAAATTPVILFSSQVISQAYGTQTLLYTFTPTYTGYIYISGTSSATTGYIRVTNNSASTYTDYAFGTGTNVTAGVIGGYNYSIRFGNSEVSGTITATLNAIYYPTSSSSTHSATLFTSHAISQTHGTQTLLYTFTPTYNGYIHISGTSSSATGYIRVTNNSTSTYTDYAFGTGNTINAVVYAGYNYSIRFGNTETSGTVTATLTGIYYY